MWQFLHRELEGLLATPLASLQLERYYGVTHFTSYLQLCALVAALRQASRTASWPDSPLYWEAVTDCDYPAITHLELVVRGRNFTSSMVVTYNYFTLRLATMLVIELLMPRHFTLRLVELDRKCLGRIWLHVV